MTRAFHRCFKIPPRGSVPKRDTILTWVHNFCTTGSCASKYVPRPQLTRTPENMERMRCDVITSRLAQTLGISRWSLQRICHKELKFHTYKIMVVQKLLPTDQKIQLNQPILGVNGRWTQINIMSDYAHFHIDGYVKKQNCCYWANANPRDLHQQPLQH